MWASLVVRGSGAPSPPLAQSRVVAVEAMASGDEDAAAAEISLPPMLRRLRPLRQFHSPCC